MNNYIFHYYENEVADNSYTVFDIEIKTVQKMLQHNINEEYGSCCVLFKNSNLSSNNIYLDAPKALKAYFDEYKLCHPVPDSAFDDFRKKLGDAVVKNALTNNNKHVDDFIFNIGSYRYLFSSFENDAKTFTCFSFFVLDDETQEIFGNYRHSSLLSFNKHVRVKAIKRFIESESNLDELKLIYHGRHTEIVRAILDKFEREECDKVKFIKYDGVRMEENFIKAVVNIAEYLGHGNYLGKMKQSTKDSIAQYIFNENKNSTGYSIEKGLKLGNTLVYYTGKGPDNENLIVLS